MKRKLRDKLAAIFCAVFRHSHLVTNCMGYKNCARCGAQLGDSIGSIGLPTGPGLYFQIDQVCNCDSCRQSFDTLTWVDKFMCPRPVFPDAGARERRRVEQNALMKSMRKVLDERADRARLMSQREDGAQ